MSEFTHSHQDAIEALAKEINAEMSAPCKHCGCTLYYHRPVGDMMCQRCYPRPAQYGSLSDEQRARLKWLFPRRGGYDVNPTG